MRAEDIVGVSFFSMLVPGVVIAISGAAKSLTAKKRATRHCVGLGMVSIAFMAFGLVTLKMIHASPRPVVEGNLWDVQELYSRNAHSSSFMITDASGNAVQVLCHYTGPGLRDGDRARVQYVAYNKKLLDLQMLSGPYQLWHLTESSGERGCWGWVGIGAVCGFFALRQSRKTAQPE